MIAHTAPVQKRPPWRRKAGRLFFQAKRWLIWQTTRHRFAQKKTELLPNICFEHRTPLLRKLKNADMALQVNKITNLRLACAKIDGIIIEPGQHFSFWFLVGKPTARKGYLEGMVIENGVPGRGIGGGLCQLGNLLYWMALHTPLTVTERWRHSFDVFPDENRTLPFGSGATLAYNYIDLQWRNDTTAPVQVHIWLTDTELCGQIRAAQPFSTRFEVLENDHFIHHEPWGGYTRHNRIFRRVFDLKTDLLLAEEQITENHAILCYSPFLNSEIVEKA